MRVAAIGFGGGDQAHDRGGAFAGRFGACEKPILTTKRYRPNGILDRVIVDWVATIVEVAP